MTDVQGIAGEQLRSFVDRIERRLDEKRDIAEGIADIYREAKAVGFDGPTIRELIKLRAMKPHDRAERSELLSLYMSALGMPE